ncbi:hypothetical protein V8D89_001893 [Ganoderma adspersum]
MSRRPGMGSILKAHPSADESMFTVFESRYLERPTTPPPPLTGTLNGDLEEYHYKAKKGKKLKAAPVPVAALESTGETDVSEPVSSMSGPPAHSLSPPPYLGYLGSSYQSSLFPQYEDPDTSDNDSTTDASMGQTMYQQFGSTGSILGGGGGGHMAYSQLAVRPSISSPLQFPSGMSTSSLPPPPGAPAYPSMQTMASSDPFLSNPRQSSTQRYAPYARRLPQTALRNQVVGQSASAPADPAYPVGPYWGAASPFEEQLEAAPNDIPAMPHGEDFAYPPVVSDQTTPIWTASWSAPRLDTAHVPQLSAATYEGWSPTDEDLQALQEMMDHPYNNGGPSTT